MCTGSSQSKARTNPNYARWNVSGIGRETLVIIILYVCFTIVRNDGGRMTTRRSRMNVERNMTHKCGEPNTEISSN